MQPTVMQLKVKATNLQILQSIANCLQHSKNHQFPGSLEAAPFKMRKDVIVEPSIETFVFAEFVNVVNQPSFLFSKWRNYRLIRWIRQIRENQSCVNDNPF